MKHDIIGQWYFLPLADVIDHVLERQWSLYVD